MWAGIDVPGPVSSAQRQHAPGPRCNKFATTRGGLDGRSPGKADALTTAPLADMDTCSARSWPRRVASTRTSASIAAPAVRSLRGRGRSFRADHLATSARAPRAATHHRRRRRHHVGYANSVAWPVPRRRCGRPDQATSAVAAARASPTASAASRISDHVVASTSMPVRARSSCVMRSGSPGTRTGSFGSTGGEALT